MPDQDQNINDSLVHTAATAAEPAVTPAAAGQPAAFDLDNMPPPSFGTLIFLERINSPFVRSPTDADGVAAIDPDGKPTDKAQAIVPTMEEIARTMYVLFNQANPAKLSRVIANPEAFDAAVMDMSTRMSLKDLTGVIAKINGLMSRINRTQTEYNMRGSEGNARPTGPTPL